ncbi:hypothetical protein OROGR_021114 [Orobanche gracilis]
MRSSRLVVKASSSDETPLDVNELLTDLKEKSPIVAIDTEKRKSCEMRTMRFKKSTTDRDIDTCIDIMRKSSRSQSSKPINKFDEVYEMVDSMWIAPKYGDEFVVDILDSSHNTPGAIILFISLLNDNDRCHFLKKH